MNDPQSQFLRYLDGQLSEEEFAELCTWMGENPANAEELVKLSLLETHLREKLLFDELSRTEAAVEQETNGKVSRSGQLPRAVEFFARPTPFSLAAAAVIIGLLITAMAMMAPPFYRAIAGGGNAETPPPRVIADITGLHEVKWAEGQTGALVGSHLLAGHRMHLKEGLAEVTFRNGAEIILEGPATFVLSSSTPDEANNQHPWKPLGRIEHGKLTAAMHGLPNSLAVETPWGAVVHVGTEFGVLVEPDGASHVVVFEGEVKLQRSQPAEALPFASLKAGQSAYVARDGHVLGRYEPRPEFVSTEAFRRVYRQAQKSVGIWRFDDPDHLGRSVGGKLSPLHVVGDAHYVANGRHGGALALDGDGDMLQAGEPLLGLPIGNSPYTVAAWIKPTRTGVRGVVGWGAYGEHGRVNALRLSDENGLCHYWWGRESGNDLIVDGRRITEEGIDLDSGNWVHVAVSWDRRTRRLYLNGQLIAQDEPAAPNVANEQFTIGHTNTVKAEFFAGLIDEIAIFRVALSESSIDAVMRGEWLESGSSSENEEFKSSGQQ